MAESALDIKILVVEDDQSLLQMITELLEAEGYSVTGSIDGETALKLASDQSFDLVITDIKLGKLDGLDTLSELQKSNSTFQSLVMTGYSTEADTIRALKLGVGNYLKKPFSLDDFLLAVQEQVRVAVSERRTQARETSALKTLSWALEAILQATPADADSDVLGPEKASLLAKRAATALALSARSIHAAKALTLLSCLQQSGIVPCDDETLRGFPEPVPQMLESLTNNNFEARSPDVQLVTLCVAASTLPVDCESPTEELREQFPELPSNLAEAIELAFADEVSPKISTPEKRRSLLTLASALQATGDRKGAAQALAKLGSSQLSSETLMASLLEARLEWESRRLDEAVSKVRKTLKTAAELGPKATGQTALEGGLLLLEMGSEEATDLLLEAQANLTKEGTAEEFARLELALMATGKGEWSRAETALSELMQARHLEQFLRAGPWLLPLLLSIEGDVSSNEVSRASRRLIRDLPKVLDTRIRDGLPRKSLVNALKGIGAVGRAGYETTLKWLLQTSEEPDIKTAVERLLGQQNRELLPPVLRTYYTGSFETWFGTTLLKWPGTKYKYIFAHIGSSPNTVVPLEGLLDIFWPDHGKRAQRCFSQALTSIRKTLQPPDWEQKLSYIERSSNGVSVNSKLPIWSDLEEISKALSEAHSAEEAGKLKESGAAVRRANRAYRGPFLSGCYMDWALSRRQSLIRNLNELTLRIATRSLDGNLNHDALAEAEEVLTRDPLSEQAQSIKMRAMAKTGRVADAIRSFEAFSRNLRLELGIEPSTELLKSYHLAKMES